VDDPLSAPGPDAAVLNRHGTLIAVDETVWSRCAGLPAAGAADVGVPVGSLVADRNAVRARSAHDVDVDVIVEVVDLRPSATAEVDACDPTEPAASLATAELVAGVLVALTRRPPGERPRALLVDDPVEARRVMSIIECLRHEHSGQHR